MRFSQFLLLVIVAFVACSSAVATTKNAVQIQDLETSHNREVVREDRRLLKASKTNSDVDAAGEERVGATTPSFWQYILGFKFPKFSIPGVKQLKALFKGLSDKNAARLRAKMQKNPNAYGF